MPAETDISSQKVEIKTLPCSIDRDKAALIVEAYSDQHSVQVQKLIYYPYYWVLFSYTVKTLIGKSRVINASCMVDMINNHAATTDKFEASIEAVPKDNILEYDYSEEEAFKTAKTYLTHAAIHKMKALLVPDYKVKERGIIYKPFWIVRCTNSNRHKFKVMVDAVTGKYQLL
jgi:hypothetical protein